jgi:hypothetical protein
MFDRADKNKDVRITRDELLQPRRKPSQSSTRIGTDG